MSELCQTCSYFLFHHTQKKKKKMLLKNKKTELYWQYCTFNNHNSETDRVITGMRRVRNNPEEDEEKFDILELIGTMGRFTLSTFTWGII